MTEEMEGKKRISVYVDVNLYERIAKDAKRLGLGVSPYFCVAASEYLKQNSVTDLALMMQQIIDQSQVDRSGLEEGAD